MGLSARVTPGLAFTRSPPVVSDVKARLWERYAPSDLGGYGQVVGPDPPVAVSVSSR